MAVWRKVIVSGSQADLVAVSASTAVKIGNNQLITTSAATTQLSGSFSGSFTGTVNATITNAISASYVSSSGVYGPYGYDSIRSASYAATASYVVNAQTASYVTTAQTASYITTAQTASYVTTAQTASYVTTAQTASFITASNVWGPFGSNSVASASLAQTSSYLGNLVQNVTITGSLFVSNSIVLTPSGSITVISGSINALSLTGSLLGTASYVTGSVHGSTNPATSASYAVTASYAANGGTLLNSLTQGTGITSFSFNGSSATTVAISGASTLTNNIVPKWDTTANKVANSNITDTGTTITLAGTTTNVTSDFQVATSKFTVAQATGNTAVAGTLSVTGNTTITGNLTVAGTASFTNTDSIYVADQFILLASSSVAGLRDGGIIVTTGGGTSGMSGSALYLEAGAAGDTGLYGRFAMAYNVNASTSSQVPDEYVVSAKLAQGAAPTDAVGPTWGSSGNNGQGNMWVTTGGDIYIWA